MIDRLIAEAIGTFIFTFIVTTAQFDSGIFAGNFGSQFSLGGGAVILMMLAGFSTDPHLNPAVTFGHLIRHFMYQGFDLESIKDHSLVMIIQFISAFPGALLGWGLNTSVRYFAPAFDAEDYQAFLAEMIFTSLIVAVALMVGKTKDSRILGCIGVGAAYYSGVLCVSYYSGACLNPAICLSANIFRYIADHDHIKHTWIYVVAPLVGGIIGAIFNSILITGAKRESLRNSLELMS